MAGDKTGDPVAAIAQANNVQAQTPEWMKGVTPQTMPQAMPGQLEAIAQQLSKGYGGFKPQEMLKTLDQTYDPVQSMNFNGQDTKKTTTPAPTTQKPMDPWTPITMHDGSTKPAWMTSLVQKTGMPRTPPGGR